MIVSVQDEFGAVPREDASHRVGVGEVVPPRRKARQRRMMDHDDARTALRFQAVQHGHASARSCASPTCRGALNGGRGSAELSPTSATRPTIRT